MSKATIDSLYEKKKEMFGRMQEMRSKVSDEAQEWTAEDGSNWDKLSSDYDRNNQQIEIEQRSLEIDTESDARKDLLERGREEAKKRSFDPTHKRSAATDLYEETTAIHSWMKMRADKPVTDNERCIIERHGFNVKELELRHRGTYKAIQRQFRMEERQFLGSLQVAEGAETVPEGFRNTLEIALITVGGMRQNATVIRTDSVGALPMPTWDDIAGAGTGNPTDEGTSLTPGTMVTGAVVLNAWKYSSDIILISNELIMDSAFDITTIVAQQCGERIGREQNAAFTTGAGTTEPTGILAATGGAPEGADAGATGAAGDITPENLIDLLHSVDIAYRQGGNVAFMMHDTTVAYVRKLRENVASGNDPTPGNFIWQPGMQAGQPDRLFGYPIIVNNSMPVLATASKSVTFGRMDKYMIRDAGGFRVRVLNELYAGDDQVGVVALQRSDGALLDAGGGPVKHLLASTVA